MKINTTGDLGNWKQSISRTSSKRCNYQPGIKKKGDSPIPAVPATITDCPVSGVNGPNFSGVSSTYPMPGSAPLEELLPAEPGQANQAGAEEQHGGRLWDWVVNGGVIATEMHWQTVTD